MRETGGAARRDPWPVQVIWPRSDSIVDGFDDLPDASDQLVLRAGDFVPDRSAQVVEKHFTALMHDSASFEEEAYQLDLIWEMR